MHWPVTNALLAGGRLCSCTGGPSWPPLLGQLCLRVQKGAAAESHPYTGCAGDHACRWLEVGGLLGPCCVSGLSRITQPGLYAGRTVTIVAAGDQDSTIQKLTFKGTRIFVQDVLDMVAKGYHWDRISEERHRRVSHEAIAEAIDLAREALMEKTRKPRRVA